MTNEHQTNKRRRAKPYAKQNRPARTEETTNDGASFFFAAGRAALIALAVGLLLLLVLCTVCLSLDDPSRYAPIFAMGASFFSALLCGILSAKMNGGKGLASGAAGGTLYAVLLWALSLCLPGGVQTRELSTSLLLSAGAIVLSAIGGFLVTHKKPKKRKIKR